MMSCEAESPLQVQETQPNTPNLQMAADLLSGEVTDTTETVAD